MQEVELDDEQHARDDAAELFDELHLRPGGAAGREHVVDDDHAHAPETASRCTCRLSVPYSRSYVASTVSRELAGLAAAMNPAPSS